MAAAFKTCSKDPACMDLLKTLAVSQLGGRRGSSPESVYHSAETSPVGSPVKPSGGAVGIGGTTMKAGKTKGGDVNVSLLSNNTMLRTDPVLEYMKRQLTIDRLGLGDMAIMRPLEPRLLDSYSLRKKRRRKRCCRRG